MKCGKRVVLVIKRVRRRVWSALHMGHVVRQVAVMLCACCLTVACRLDDSSNALFLDAQAAFERREYKSAIIHLRNALDRNPFHREAQFLLGETYLALEDGKLAEQEIRKARQLNVGPEQVLPALARALSLSGAHQRILDEIVLPPELTGVAAAKILTERGKAHFSLTQLKDAERAYVDALRYEPDYPDALLGQAALQLARNDSAAASVLVDRALAKAPKHVAAWILKGDLARARLDHAASAKAYSEALTNDPQSLPALLNRAFALIELGEHDKAKADVTAARGMAPRHPLANYLQGLISFRQGDYAQAREFIALTLRSAPEYSPAILISGAVELALGAPQKAESELGRVIRTHPDGIYARKLLAFTYLKLNQPKRAVEVIEPALAGQSTDPVLLGLAGDIYMRAGDFARATDLLQRAVALDPKRAELYKGLGMVKLGQGQSGSAAKEFRKASDLDPEGHQGDFLLAATQLQQQHFDDARATAQQLSKRQPKNPVAHHLIGEAALGKRDIAGARRAFERALGLSPSYFPAALSLGKLDVAEGNVAAARRRFEQVLKHDKSNWQAMMALGSLASRERNAKEALGWIERARDADATALPPRLLLVRHHLESGDQPVALNIAFEAEKAHPNVPDAVEALGLAQLAAGQIVSAQSTFQRLTTLVPSQPTAHYRLAEALVAGSKLSEAEQALRRTLQLKPDLVDAHVALARVLARLHRHSEAISIARELQSSNAKSPTGHQLEGEVLLREKKFDAALEAFERAFVLRPSGAILASMHDAALRRGNATPEERRISEWLRKHPQDLALRMYIAESHLKVGRTKDAAQEYEAVIGVRADNFVALNNLASAYRKLKDERAFATAEKALKLKPEHPALLDTMGWILYERGDVARALGYLERAAAAAPKSTEIQYHLAAALAKSGDRQRAREIAKKIVDSGGQLPAGENPTRLLD